ncbi:MAG: dTMP kinase [Acholeplasmataceae bacterium]|jgi:dTMP kinase|nr:dTMP kinase [Acholeplasmataceae bacterium]
MFITFEGGEGSGKTSLIKAVSKWLFDNNLPNITTREPGGSEIAEKIRDILLDVDNENIAFETEALLFAAARTQHLKEVVLPALAENQVVLCDRYLDSSLAYQGYARKLGFEAVLKINYFALKHLPNFTVYIDIDPKVGLKRAGSRGKLNRLDLEELSFHQKVREGYLELSKIYQDRYLIIDGNCSLNNLIEKTINELAKVIL